MKRRFFALLIVILIATLPYVAFATEEQSQDESGYFDGTSEYFEEVSSDGTYIDDTYADDTYAIDEQPHEHNEVDDCCDEVLPNDDSTTEEQDIVEEQSQPEEQNLIEEQHQDELDDLIEKTPTEYDYVAEANVCDHDGEPCIPHFEPFWLESEELPSILISEICPFHPEPRFIELAGLIDELPNLDDVKRMDSAGVLEVSNAVYAIRDRIVATLADEKCNCFDLELGAARIEKYNSLFLYIDEYIRNNLSRGRTRSAGATRIDIGVGRVEVTNDNLLQRGHVTMALIGTYPHNPDGYLLYGTYDYAINAWVLSFRTVHVLPGVTTTLYFENLNITNTNRDPNNHWYWGTLYDFNYICVDVTGSDTTIILMDGTINRLTGGIHEGGGALVKNDATDGRTLTIACERWREPGHMCTGTETGALPPGSCGRLEAIGFAYHSAAIGSTRDAIMEHSNSPRGGFGNLFIRGGIIVARNASGDSHAPGIGSMCGTAFVRGGTVNFTNPQMLGSNGEINPSGQISRNIHISGGRVFAYGGGNSSGIGSGYGGPVDGIYISDGAYVYARGGQNSPGIGSGGGVDANSLYHTNMAAASYNVYNIIISGGRTVVEAEGSNTVQSPLHSSVPGIGSGISSHGRTGTMTNVQAQPEPGWLALVRAGTSKQNSTYINGTPSPINIDILPDMYYTLVHFSGLQKTASVNGGLNETGSKESMISVQPGNRIRYTINTANWSAETNSSYTLMDEIPRGMTLVTDVGSFYPSGMAHETINGITTVRWENQTSAGEFFFTVTVDNTLMENELREYINEAVMITTIDQLEIPTNKTYHHALWGARNTTLLVSKEVAGDFGNRIREFEFTIYFQDSVGNPPPPGTQFPYIGEAVNTLGGTAPTNGTLTLDGSGRATFRLAHGQAIRIAEIPLHFSVRIVEETDTNYQASFIDSEYANISVSGTDTNIRPMTGNREFHFTNARIEVPVTGLSLTNTKEILLLLVLISLSAVTTFTLRTAFKHCKKSR